MNNVKKNIDLEVLVAWKIILKSVVQKNSYTSIIYYKIKKKYFLLR
jgi:hypothetical protein